MSDLDPKSWGDLEKVIDRVREAHSKGKISVAELYRSVNRLNEKYASPEVTQRAGKEGGLADEFSKVQEATQGVIDRLDPLAAATRKYGEERQRLEEAFALAAATNSDSVNEYRIALEGLKVAYEENQRAGTIWGKLTQGIVDDIDQVAADAWKGTLVNSEAIWKKLKADFKLTLEEMAHEAITKPIIISFASQVLGTSSKGGISDVWGKLFSGNNSGNGSGGGGFGNIVDVAKNIYSIYDTLTGVVPVAYAGFQNGGLSGAITGVGNYYGGMLGSAANTIGSWFGGQATSQVVQGGAGWMLDAAGNLVNTATPAGANAVGIGAGNAASAASSFNPVTWAIAALLGSNSFYKAGYRLDHKQIANQKLSKIHFAMDPALSSVFDSMMKATQFASKYVLEPLLGEKWGNIVSLGPLFSGISNTVNKALFGGSWQTKDYGIGLGVEGGELDARQFEYRKKKGGLFSKSKKKTVWTDLDEETLAGFEEAFDTTEEGVSELFKQLGLTVQESSLAGLQIAKTQISTKGKTEEEIATAVREWFSSAATAMTAELNRVFGTGLDLDFMGMQAFVGNLVGVNDLLKTIQIDEFEVSVAGGKMAEHLSEVAGGFDVLSSSVSTYYNAFFSESERFDAALRAATEQFKAQFEALDIEEPTSAAAFREMAEGIDKTTESGREMFATMMALAGQVDTYFKLVEQNAANTLSRQLSAASSSFALVQRSISAEQQRLTAEYQAKAREMDAQAQAYAQAAQAQAAAQANSLQVTASKASERIGAIGNVIGSLDQALGRLRDTSGETTKQLRSQAVATVEQALAGVKAGQSVLNFPGLEEALGRASELDGNTFASLEFFQREQGRTANMVAELRGLAGKQLTSEELVLQSLEAQLSVARSHAGASGVYYSDARAALDREYEQAMEALQIELDEAQRQMDALNGIDNSVMSVVDAVNAMSSSVTAALKFMGTGSTPTATGENTAQLVDRMYKAIAGFAPDAGGIHFWVDQLTTGKSTYAEFIKALEGARVPAFAVGGLHTGGLRLVGENGPELEVTGPSRIYSASQTAAMLSSGATEEVRALRSDFAGMSDALRSIAKHTQQTARRVETLERWDGDGMPGERTA